MQQIDRDIALLWDMREAAKEIQQFLDNVTFHKFNSDKILRYAIERQIMVLGEAANRISQQFKDDHPQIPWIGIVAQRNVLAHEYGEILIERIWYVAIEQIPELITQLNLFIPPPPPLEEI